MNYEVRSEISKESRKKLSNYPDLLAHLLHHRGLIDNKSAEEFLNVDYKKSHDPESLKDIDIATDRILKAINEDEKICVFSDYDADGIPGAVILTDFFRKIGFENFFVYIPHRNIEGFGLNMNAIDKIIEQQAKVLITIDCGISDVKQINHATKNEIDVIITDHHDPNNHKSSAIAVINPKQSDCNYPDKNLCGSGVIFKVVQALIKKGKFDLPDGWEKWLLDMVGIATLSDMVPLIGENRIFAKYGLLVLQKSPRKGLQKLLNKCRTNQNTLDEMDVGFTIAPRINAASRMDNPEIAYQMLSTTNDVEAGKTVDHLDKINNERKGHVAAMVKEIKKSLESNNESPIIVRGNPKWQPSLLGLAASSIVDTYHKPVFLWGRGEGSNLKGSCRSDGSVNLVTLMNNVKDGTISDFGGHEMAGGFEVTDDGVHSINDKIEKAYESSKSEDIDRKIIVDCSIPVSEINQSLFDEVSKLAPFGVGNETPNFILEKVKVESVDKFGKANDHLRINLTDGFDKNVEAIKFFAADNEKVSDLEPGKEINLIGTLEKSNFGKPSIRLRIVDFEVL